MTGRGLVLLALALPGWGWTPRASAQELRNYTVERARRAETDLHAVIDFAAGSFFLRPATSGALYRLELRYDTERYRPVGSFDPARGLVQLGVEKASRGGIRVVTRDRPAQRAVVELSPDVALTLEANLGASESSLELGGLRLEDLSLVIGASRTEVRFSRPNPVLCRKAAVTTGAAEFIVKGLGNSGCRRWEVGGGVGAVRLELDGSWPERAQVRLSMTLGGVTLVAPRDLGVRIRLDRFLATFSPVGFTRDGNVYTSDNFGRAARQVEFDISTTLGDLRVEWR